MHLARFVDMYDRHTEVVQRAAIAAITLGVLIYGMGALTSAEASSPALPHANARVIAAPTVTPSSAEPVTTLPPRPVTVAKPAPATHQTISGLAANGIPNVALNAYRVAAARMHNVDPGCGIDWALLAGIGREESDHGRFGGAVLHADGTSTPRIIGPALDGRQRDYIPAPANGKALDGDAVYAHALGPMQFIPSTWADYAVSANGDGTADIFNINDAALTAARYLCAAGGDLRTHAGLVRAVLAYNHDSEYLAQVLALAQAYRSGVTVTGIPVGQTTGALPPIRHLGATPPANPGGPTANEPSSTSTAPPTTAASTPHTPSDGAATPAPSPTTPPATSPSRQPSPTTTSPKPTPAPTATPAPTCKLGLLTLCILP